jgi:hypothetical protein
MVKKAHVPPAKRRYDEKHPTISFRVSRKDYDLLRGTLNKQGKTIGQFFRVALGVEMRNYEEARRRGYRKGLEDGFQRYAIVTLCVACMKAIVIEDEKTQTELVEAVETGDYCNLCMDCDPPDLPAGWEIRRHNRVP